jgi:hypothetical protein
MSKATTSSSQIDDIFSRKSAIPENSQHSSPNYKQKKRKNNRSQTQLAKSKRPPPEIVLDPSIRLSHDSTSKTISHDRPVRPVLPGKKRKLVESRQDQDTFRDSRGTVPRKRFPNMSSAELNRLQAAKPKKGLQYSKKASSVLMQKLEVCLTP